MSYPCRLITVHMYIIAVAENVFLHGCNILCREKEALVALLSFHIHSPAIAEDDVYTPVYGPTLKERGAVALS